MDTLFHVKISFVTFQYGLGKHPPDNVHAFQQQLQKNILTR